jgi:hypothetical protein
MKRVFTIILNYAHLDKVGQEGPLHRDDKMYTTTKHSHACLDEDMHRLTASASTLLSFT